MEIAEESPERIRHWKLDRFIKATALDEWFKLPADFDLEQHLGLFGVHGFVGRPLVVEQLQAAVGDGTGGLREPHPEHLVGRGALEDREQRFPLGSDLPGHRAMLGPRPGGIQNDGVAQGQHLSRLNGERAVGALGPFARVDARAEGYLVLLLRIETGQLFPDHIAVEYACAGAMRQLLRLLRLSASHQAGHQDQPRPQPQSVGQRQLEEPARLTRRRRLFPSAGPRLVDHEGAHLTADVGAVQLIETEQRRDALVARVLVVGVEKRGS
jgi:hypothetical protein